LIALVGGTPLPRCVWGLMVGYICTGRAGLLHSMDFHSACANLRLSPRSRYYDYTITATGYLGRGTRNAC
jgi:hypothetical protein